MMTESQEFLSWLWLSPHGRLLAGLWGALWGSFFNVLIIRLPADESVVFPASHCRACKEPIPWYDNIPLLSYILLRGRCRTCRVKFSGRYFLIELLVCALALLMHQLFVLDGTSPLGLRMAQFTITSLFCGFLVAITFIDLDTLLIPNTITYPGIPVCVGLSLFMELPHLWDGLAGAVAGYALIWLVAEGYRLLTGRQGMGFGDAKLLAMIGALLGWQVLLPVIFLASLQGTFIGIPILLISRRRRPGATTDRGALEGEEQGDQDPSEGSWLQRLRWQIQALRHVPLPLGPFLCLATVEILCLRELIFQLFPLLWLI